jgi:hypothetical protein
MLADTFGFRDVATASWELFTTAKAAIDALFSKKWPDIALVDVNLTQPEDNEAPDTVGEHADTRGLVVAAALQSLSCKRPIVVLYTANQQVEGIQSRVLAIPPVLEKRGVRPLIQIEHKAAKSAPEAVLTWIEREIRRQAETRIKALGSGSTESKELCEVMLRLQEAPPAPALLAQVWEAVHKLKTSFAELPGERRCRLDRSMIAHAEKQRCRRPDAGIAELRQAFADGASDGWALEQWKQKIEPLVDQFEAELEPAVNSHRKNLREVVKALRGRDWYGGLRYLAPIEFRRLEAFAEDDVGSSEACSAAILKILSLLSCVDHTASLARAFLHLSVDGGDRVPTTAFAHACHQWSRPQHWTYGVDYNVSDEVREHYLAQELGLESGGPFPKLLLPERSRKHIVDLGKEFNAEFPLVGFATNWNTLAINRYWLDDPKRRLREFGWDAEWAEECAVPEPKGIDVLTDWNLLFADRDSLIREVMTVAEAGDPSRVVVTLRDGRKRVSVRFEFDKVFTKAAINLKVQCGGGTTAVLRKFLNWGELMVISTTPNGIYQARRGVDPTQLENFSGTPFQVELTLTNYNETRLTGEET